MATKSIVGYIRVSTREQEERGISIEAQEEKIRKHAKDKDLVLSKIYYDKAESGKDLNRPSLKEIMDGINAEKISHLIVYKLDRLTRSLADLANLLVVIVKKDIALVSVVETIDTSTATGRLMVQMIGMFAEWERGQIVERTQVAIDLKRSKGEKLGGRVPYGYRVKKKGDSKILEACEPEQAIIRGVLKARREGRGYQDIALALDEQGVKCRKAKRWYTSMVRDICLRAGVQREKKRA